MTSNTSIPRILKEIESWPSSIKADYARLIEMLMEFGPDLRMPHSKAMGNGLFEIRPKGKDGIGRAFYCFVKEKRIIILHAFIIKSQVTPHKQLLIARKRMNEVI
ncbi:type II toxin-antitoxin system RelE/ParE family toxin [Prosthecochloris sp. HL-130-GSB]|jgi:phage-related protein|uniref:type II toxin-antitoxin system RelE/ParE family toxin n=1 Tax=Prosthecochloris sp. HL-130-GSB TaxID=1974213 RepID=UPI001E64CF9F|nr:type II toxin-antitoxin system RelE/ParE family toxin [Prosthecochloris sp. HL-130-GSB]